VATGVNQAKTPVATGVNQAKTPVATGVNQDKTPVANAPGSPSSTALLRQRIATELGRCLAHLHRAGVTHDDLHPGNLLIRFESEAIRFYLLDLHDLGLGRELSWSRSLANLAVFNRWFLMRCSRTDRLRFWEAYRRERGWDQRLSLRVEAATWRSNEQFWLSRDGRCLRDNRYFQIVRAPGISGFAVKEIDRGFLQSLVGNPDAPFESTQNQFLKNSRSSTVIELEMPTPQGPRAMIFKRFRLRSGTDLLANAFRTSPAVRSWQMGHGLLERGLPTARPWLVLHRKRWGLKAEGYLLCEKIEAATDLASFVEKGTLEDRRRLLERLARLIRKLHQVKLSHRDLKAANLLVQADGTLTFIDLVGVRVEGAISRRTRVQNLTRLNASFLNSKTVSHTDRLRFLLLYLNAGLHRDTDWRSWWRSISEATSAKVLRNQKRGRPLA
jgi:tRNA A-37 threonylcarbamoyl transferase component Bud32